MPVEYKEIEGSPRENITPDGMRATRIFECAWADRLQFAGELAGIYNVAYNRPRQTYPGQPRVAVKSIAIEPWPPDNPGNPGTGDPSVSLASYDFARLTVEYDTVPEQPTSGIDWGKITPPDIPPGSFLSYSGSIGVELLTLPGRMIRWDDNPAIPMPEDANAAIRIPVIEHSLTWSKVVSPPWDTIADMTGTINQGVFLGRAAETLMFDGAEYHIEFDLNPDSPPRWKLTYKFLERRVKDFANNAIGWNHLYREHAPRGWRRVSLNNGNDMLIQNDFNALFQFAAEGDFS